MTTKFFKTIDEQGFYVLYVCDANTPIPTMKEIIERNNLSPYCESEIIKEITREECDRKMKKASESTRLIQMHTILLVASNLGKLDVPFLIYANFLCYICWFDE